nr:hypothetical protein [Tanacetum cinerariifolium]
MICKKKVKKNCGWARRCNKGGLGVSSLYALNRALLFKWVWRFRTQISSLWAKVIKGIHGEDVLLKRKWVKGWTHLFGRTYATLKSLYPRVYALETSKNITVAKKMSHVDLGFSLRRNPRGGIEQVQFTDLSSTLEDIVDMRDRWVWSLEGTDDFSVASVRRRIDDLRLQVVSSKTRWVNSVPIKINIHAWKVRNDGLPTRLNISKRGMDIAFISCPVCGLTVKSVSHIFFACQFAREVFYKVCNWWDVTFTELSCYEDWSVWLLNIRLHSKHKS